MAAAHLSAKPVANVGLPGLAFHPDGRLFASTVTSGNPSSLIQINPDTGALIATIGQINDNGTPLSIGDLSFQPGTGVLYGITSNTLIVPEACCTPSISPRRLRRS